MTAIATKRFVSELDHLRHCERIVLRGMAAVFEVAAAIREIREQKLWKHAEAPAGEATYANFDDYAQRVLGITRNYAGRLINSVEVTESVPIGTISNEAQARELAKAPKDERESVVKEAGLLSSRGKPTAKAIKEVIEKRRKSSEPTRQDEEADEPTEIVEETSAEIDNPVWDEIAVEAHSIAYDLGNRARVSDFLDCIAEEVNKNAAVAYARLSNLSLTMRPK